MPKLTANWRNANLLEAVFDQISDALVLYDANHIITGVNLAAERLFEMSASELVGRDCHEMFRCQQCEPGCGMHTGLLQANGNNATVRLHTDNGLERLVVIRTAQVLNDDGSVQGVVATIKDVTDEVEPQKREIVSGSPAMNDLLHFVRRVAISEATTVLLEGENGTGKDLIAKSLHYQSTRQAEPFIAINCAAIPETLLESELFGYEKGAFTDARAQKKGIFELADKGTLFLDEIGEIPLILQAKLLRVLEEQSFRRLGGLKDIQLDLRVIAATNKNLREAVREGAFRQDLYFRLNVIHITIPPLRERFEDIPVLADFFVKHYNRKFKRQIEGLTPEALQLLESHDWPGNVRELRNAVERAMILEDSSFITPASLPMSVSHQPPGASQYHAAAAAAPAGLPAAGPLPDAGMSLEDNEKRLLVQALEKTAGNQTQAARLLRITRDTLRYKMKKFDIR
ncbi:MAG: sigma 54-interacting transcriptional regulator [Bryobacteraceae bacterium]|nr:sigma 54-interacting transcriptional regulator [Solibacteraceae bacterium]MCL4842601.1 sigma 54-interacting transcriptional regulator [Bryobacteraceae bacterium]MCO5353138.1 sigma 54-interacting transcriptional regulator [Bryobacteraceae bacterium]